MARFSTSWIGLVFLAAACGRLGYQQQNDDGGHAADAPGDASLDASSEPDGAPAVDAFVPAASCADRFPGALVCDDFEDTLDLWALSTTGGGTAEIDPTRSHTGVRSFRVATPPAELAAAKVIGSYLGGRTSGELHVRAWYFVPEATARLEAVSLMNAVDTNSPYPGIVIDVVRDDVMRILSTIEGRTVESPVPLPRGRWFCLQLDIAIAGASAGSARLSIDGVPAVSLDSADTSPPNGYTDLHAGTFFSTFQTERIEYWIDDLVAADSSVPCD